MKNIGKHLIQTTGTALIATVLLGGCASIHAKTAAATGDTASTTIAQAQAAVAKAAPRGALWSVSVQDLAQAKKAEAAGKDPQAIGLAREVLRQVALSEAQAQAGKDAKPVYPGA